MCSARTLPSWTRRLRRALPSALDAKAVRATAVAAHGPVVGASCPRGRYARGASEADALRARAGVRLAARLAELRAVGALLAEVAAGRRIGTRHAGGTEAASRTGLRNAGLRADAPSLASQRDAVRYAKVHSAVLAVQAVVAAFRRVGAWKAGVAEAAARAGLLVAATGYFTGTAMRLREAQAADRLAVGARLAVDAALGVGNARSAGIADAAARAVAGVARGLPSAEAADSRGNAAASVALLAHHSIQTALVRIRSGKADVPVAAPTAGGEITRRKGAAAGVMRRIADLKSFGHAVPTRFAERAALGEGPASLAGAGGIAASAGAGGRVARGAVRPDRPACAVARVAASVHGGPCVYAGPSVHGGTSVQGEVVVETRPPASGQAGQGHAGKDQNRGNDDTAHWRSRPATSLWSGSQRLLRDGNSGTDVSNATDIERVAPEEIRRT